MKQIVQVELPGREYSIEIQRGLLDQVGEECRVLLPRARRIFVVTDHQVAQLYLKQVEDSFCGAGFQVKSSVIPTGEGSKSVFFLQKLWEAMIEFQMTRTDAVVALGGGVVGDLAGFAAATIFRGIDLIQIPTTLMSQVDSSVGGKVAIDLEGGKNLVGAFWQPRGVFMDPNCLDTLSHQVFSDGMAEVIKYGCIRDRSLLDLLIQCGGRSDVMEHIEGILYRCCVLKQQIVAQDERDSGLRMILNFGHTLGHAFEVEGQYTTWTHGQGVAAGMSWALQLGADLGITPPQAQEELGNILTRYDLPQTLPCPWDTMKRAIGLDKKGAGDQITMILLERLGWAIGYPMEKKELLQRLQRMCGRV